MKAEDISERRQRFVKARLSKKNPPSWCNILNVIFLKRDETKERKNLSLYTAVLFYILLLLFIRSGPNSLVGAEKICLTLLIDRHFRRYICESLFFKLVLLLETISASFYVFTCRQLNCGGGFIYRSNI